MDTLNFNFNEIMNITRELDTAIREIRPNYPMLNVDFWRCEKPLIILDMLTHSDRARLEPLYNAYLKAIQTWKPDGLVPITDLYLC